MGLSWDEDSDSEYDTNEDGDLEPRRVARQISYFGKLGAPSFPNSYCTTFTKITFRQRVLPLPKKALLGKGYYLYKNNF